MNEVVKNDTSEPGYSPVQLDGFSKASELAGRASRLEKQARELRQASQEIDSAATAGASGEAINRIFNKATAAPESTVPNFSGKYLGVIRKIEQRLAMRDQHRHALETYKAARPDEITEISKIAKQVRNDEEELHARLQELERISAEAQAFPGEYLAELKAAAEAASLKLADAESRIADNGKLLKDAIKANKSIVEAAKAVSRPKDHSLDKLVPGIDPLLLMGQPTPNFPKPIQAVEPGSHQDGPARATAKTGSSIFSVLRGSSGAGRSGIGRGSL